MKSRFRKLGFRTMGVVIGLWLGWQAAGMADNAQGHVASEGTHVSDVPFAPSNATASWYPMVLAIAVGLFVAAIVIGRPAMKLKGEEPAEDDHHDDHGHDGHDDHGDHDDNGDGHGH